MDGILNIYKPPGPTSHDIVDKIRRITGIRKVGHAGTLDPFAEGVLIILIGKATKLQPEFIMMPKTYIATLKLGMVSNTYDVTGVKSQIPRTKLQTISKSQIQKILKTFIGEIKQTPPIYSAIKIKGKKAYELARKGIKPKLKPRKVKIYDIKLLNYKWPNLKIEVKCSKGTYIRSLANDIGQKLGCGAYLEKLIRTRIGDFTVDKSTKLARLNKNNWQKYLITIEP